MAYFYRAARARLAEAVVADSVISLERKVYSFFGEPTSILHIYHCPTDPHSHLLIQGCQVLLRHYEIQIQIRIISEPKLAGLAAYGAGEEQQFAWRVEDSVNLAALYKDLVTMPEEIVPAMRIDPELCMKALRLLLLMCEAECTVETLASVVRVGEIVLSNGSEDELDEMQGVSESKKMGDAEMQEKLRENLDRLAKQGHYNSGMIRAGPEWFWGLDRLLYLEKRLLDQKLNKSVGQKPIFSRTHELACAGPEMVPLNLTVEAELQEPSHAIDLFWSFGSPYAQLVLHRIMLVADYYKVTLNIKPLIPKYGEHTKRPFAKTLYLLRDTKREASSFGWKDFGRTSGVSGEALSNAFAGYVLAEEQGRSRQYLLTFSEMAWAKGADFSQMSEMQKLFSDSGTEWDATSLEQAQETWKGMDAVHSEELNALGLWGVPSLTYGNVKVWGQDRLFVLERAIREDVIPSSCGRDTV